MITLNNKDGFIFDLEYRVVDILEEYQRTGAVEINTNAEGICLQQIKFYSLLNYICDKFNIEKSHISILTSNALEHHDEYKIIVKPISHWFRKVKTAIPKNYSPSKLNNLLGQIGRAHV